MGIPQLNARHCEERSDEEAPGLLRSARNDDVSRRSITALSASSDESKRASDRDSHFARFCVILQAWRRPWRSSANGLSTSSSVWRGDARCVQARSHRLSPGDARIFCLPRLEARQKAREWFERYPKAAYMTEIEFWRELEDDHIEFVMRRLPTAD